MMDKNWTETAAEQTKGLVKDHDDLVRASGRATKKLADEQSLLEREQRHRVALLAASRECLAGNEADLSYLKFKADVRKTDENVTIAQDSIQILKKDVLPSLQRQLTTATQQLSSALRTYCINRKEVAEAALIEGFYDLFAAYDAFLDEAQGLYNTAGLQMRIRNRSLAPGKFLQVLDKFRPDFFRALEMVREIRQQKAAAVVPEAVEPDPEPEVSVPAEVPEPPLPSSVPEVSGAPPTETPEPLPERVLGLSELEQDPDLEESLAEELPPVPETAIVPEPEPSEFDGPGADSGPIPPCMPAARTLSSTVGIGGEAEATDDR